MNLSMFLTFCMNLMCQSFIRYMASNYSGNLNKGRTPTASEFYHFGILRIPLIYAVDGFHVSIQIANGNYCSSENGYREFGQEWKTAEFGFSSEHEPMLDEYAEESGDTTNSVGSVPIEVLQAMFDKHGGIDWVKTMSSDNLKNLIN